MKHIYVVGVRDRDNDGYPYTRDISDFYESKADAHREADRLNEAAFKRRVEAHNHALATWRRQGAEYKILADAGLRDRDHYDNYWANPEKAPKLNLEAEYVVDSREVIPNSETNR